MKRQEKLELLKNAFKEKDTQNFQELVELGLSITDLSIFAREGILIRIKRGIYKIASEKDSSMKEKSVFNEPKMTKQQKLEIIYTIFKENETRSREEIRTFGLENWDIGRFTNEGILVRVKRDVYTVSEKGKKTWQEEREEETRTYHRKHTRQEKLELLKNAFKEKDTQTTQELEKLGISIESLSRFTRQKTLIRIKRGVYQFRVDEKDSLNTEQKKEQSIFFETKLTRQEKLEIVHTLFKGNETRTIAEIEPFGLRRENLVDFVNKGVLVRVKRGIYALSEKEKKVWEENQGKMSINPCRERKTYQDKLEILQSIFTNQEIQTCIQLRINGIKPTDITELIKKGDLVRISRGVYTLSEKENQQEEKSQIENISPTKTEVLPDFNLFLLSLENKDYDTAIQCFKEIYNCKNDENSHNYNLYLYLLNLITPLPEEYQSIAKNIKISDCKVERIGLNDNKNNFRHSIINQKLSKATVQFQEYLLEKEADQNNQIIQVLLKQARQEAYREREIIINLLKEKNYEELQKFLENLGNRHTLSLWYENILILVEDLLQIQSTNTPPKKNDTKTNNLFDAIRYKNYRLALQLATINSRDKDENEIYILLKEIVNKLNKMKIDAYLENLLQDDVGSFSNILNAYLEKINDPQYIMLIKNLININLLRGDSTFMNVTSTLEKMHRGEFELNIADYICAFYETLAEEKIEEAKIYLEIIEKLSENGHLCTYVDALKCLLEKEEEDLLISPRKQESLYQTAGGYQETMKEILARVEEKGLVLINLENIEQQEEILNMLAERADIDKASISLNDAFYICLRKLDLNQNPIEIFRCSERLEYLGNEENYIIYYQTLLKTKHPNIQAYIQMGEYYLRNNDLKTALDYFTTLQAKIVLENLDYNYNDTIIKIKNKQKQKKM